MKYPAACLVAALLITAMVQPSSAQQPDYHLEPLARFVGKTWRGEASTHSPETPMVDISHWEWALNGRAIRILHSVNDGEYGGESIVMWDPEAEALSVHYFTTAGFMTRATLEVLEDGYRSVEDVSGHEGGITRVEAVAHVLPDGRLRSTSRYLRNGDWVDGHSITYAEAPSAKVIFRNP
jgi:hypothetical protein